MPVQSTLRGAWERHLLDATKDVEGGLDWRGPLARSHLSDGAGEGHRSSELGLSHLSTPTRCSCPWADPANLSDLSLPF